MPRITLSMIIKNAEMYLERCLESVKDVVDEIVIVDTGSTDNSLEIAKKYNAQIFHFDWINDFSAARNFALEKSAGDWILYLDADERLSDSSIEELKKITREKNLIGYQCSVNSIAGNTGSSNIMKYIRLFANHPKAYFYGKAHEQIERSLLELGYKILDSGIEIIHLGYDVSSGELKKKAERNLKLLVNEFKNNPNSYTAFQIGQTYITLDEIEKSEPYFLFTIKDKNFEKNHLAHCYRYLAALELNIKNNLDKALEFANEGVKNSGKQPLLHAVLSNIYLRKSDFQKAEEYCRKAQGYNYEQLQRKSSGFEILVKNEDLINHGLNVAMFSCNKNFFNDFYNKLPKEKCDKKRLEFLSVFNSVFNNIPVDENLQSDVGNIITPDFFESFVFLLSKYDDLSRRAEILETLLKKYSKEIKIISLLGNTYVELGNKEKALEVFETALALIQNDPLILFNMIALSAELGRSQKLIALISKAEEVFKDNPAILEKLRQIKLKITAAAN